MRRILSVHGSSNTRNPTFEHLVDNDKLGVWKSELSLVVSPCWVRAFALCTIMYHSYVSLSLDQILYVSLISIDP